MTPLPAPRALDQFFLDARSKLLDLAAFLDRIDRGDGSADADPRAAKIDAALKILLSDATNQAEQLQQLFSLDYNPAWARPQPRF